MQNDASETSHSITLLTERTAYEISLSKYALESRSSRRLLSGRSPTYNGQ